MKALIKSLLVLSILSFSGLILASNSLINLTVKGYHNSNERILDSNSVLFTGDSFQLSVEALDTIHIYAFLIDSSNNLQLLNSPNLPSLVTQNQLIHFPSSTENWFQLDDNVGIETLMIVSKSSKINASEITLEELIKLDDVERFTIKHIGTKLAMRGIGDVKNSSEENLSSSIKVSPMLAESLTPILNNNSQSRTIIQIMEDSKGARLNTSTKTRGVKEVRIFEDSAPSVVYIRNPTSVGTGVLISNDGLVFTNSHVVGNSKKVSVYFMPKNSGKYSDQDFVQGMVVNNNQEADLALIKLVKTPVGRKPLSLANENSIKIGQDVHAIGHPGLAAEWTYTRGYIGQILKNYEWDYDDGIKRKAKVVIQSQTPIMGGNSGGPLLNDAGQVIGVNSFSNDYYGATYAVSLIDLKLFLNEKFTIPKMPAKTAETIKASKYMEANVIRVARHDYDENGELDTYFFLDRDNTGIWEILVIELNGSNEGVLIYDYDENGIWNEKVINTNDNPRLDFYIFDRDGDGKADQFGYDDNDDGEIDRYENA
ncbi:trypsin-like peptidase domain-containing protein [Candidatus Thioglobus sp.]|nr:trypsin-like peptidase domain-containing protein [Candidatus Thioglobus sp.]